MTETNLPSEHLELPPNWTFLERDRTGLKVVQIDPSQGFLAFTLPSVPEYGDNPSYKGEYGDYYFDAKGKPTDFRIHACNDTAIELQGDIPIAFKVHENQGSVSFNLRGTFQDRLDRFSVGTASEPTLGKLGGFMFDHQVSGRPIELTACVLGSLFTRQQKGKDGQDIESPLVFFEVKYEKGMQARPYRLEDWEYHILESTDFTLQEGNEPNKICFLDKQGKEIYQVEWKFEPGEDEDNIFYPTFVIKQTHISSGIVKTLKAPTVLNKGRVVKAVFELPPYQTEKIDDKVEVLQVPWKSLDQAVGVTLNYSYSLPKQETKEETSEEVA